MQVSAGVRPVSGAPSPPTHSTRGSPSLQLPSWGAWGVSSPGLVCFVRFLNKKKGRCAAMKNRQALISKRNAPVSQSEWSVFWILEGFDFQK